MKYDVICIGTLVRDIFLSSRQSSVAEGSDNSEQFCFPAGAKTEFNLMSFDVGGEAANVAVALSLLGIKTALISKVGADESGQALVKELKSKKVSCDLIKQDPKQQTGYGIMVVNDAGEKTALVYRGAASQLEISDVPLTKLKSSWLFMSSQGGNVKLLERIAASSRKKGTKVAFNPGPYELELGLRALLPVLRNVELLAMNRNEAAVLTGHNPDDIRVLFDALTVATPGLVMITDGIKGVYVAPRVSEEEAVYFAPSTGMPAKEKTGAGDAFLSGFLASLIKNEDDIERALQLGTLNAESAIKEVGAQKGLLKRFPSQNQQDKIRVTKH